MTSIHDSDSENDPDYVPEDVKDSDSSDDEDNNHNADANAGTSPENVEEQKKERDALWAQFRAGDSSSVKKQEEVQPVRMVKIEKRYRFAGDDVVDVVEVPEDSEDAKKWPRWLSPEERSALSEASPQADEQLSKHSETSQTQIFTTVVKTSTPETIITSPVTSALTSVLPSRPGPVPGPRRPKKTLLTQMTPKPKKLTTLEKSAMDWRAHVDAESVDIGGGVVGGSMRDELEANRRAGGYLEKVDFLDRVGARREEIFERERSVKRRKAG